MNKSLFENPIFCYHWWLTIHQWTEFQYPIPLMSKISCAKYIPLLCRIWPQLLQKSSSFYQQSLGMIQTRIPNSQIPCWQDQSYSSANYIHCSANCLSLFTIHNSQLFYLFPCQLRGWASDFFLEGRHLSKIRLGANVTLIEFFTR